MFKMWKAAFMVLVALCWGCYPKATSQRPGLCKTSQREPARHKEKQRQYDYAPGLTFRLKSGKQMANTLFVCVAKIGVSA
jgi:hypothetical protein